MDPEAIERATGWQVVHRASTRSTNDDAARLRDGGTGARTAVVADRQTAGRGRAGRSFASPAGGLYVSMLLCAAPGDLPARMVALTAVALAEALERVGVPRALVKWPNDIWIGRRKVAGILLESTDPTAPLIAGLGVNLAGVPASLPRAVSAGVTHADAHTQTPVQREALLTVLLQRVDHWQARLAAGEAPALEAAWQARLALLRERVRLIHAGTEIEGTFEAASLAGGLLVRDDHAGPVWREAALAQDLRPA